LSERDILVADKPIRGNTMANWINFVNQANRLTFVDLDAMPIITVDDKSQRIDFWSGSAFFTLEKKKALEVYQKVLDFLSSQMSQS
jgi:hypothetical protein